MTSKVTANLLIFCPVLSSRVAYTFSLLFEWVFPLKYRLTTNLDEWKAWSGPRIQYGPTRFKDHSLAIPSGHLLFEEAIRPQDIIVERLYTLPFFFKLEGGGSFDLPFDLPALCFYLSTRYEEYLPFKADNHQRFPASESLAHREGFLRMPLINTWVFHLVEKLENAFPGTHFPRPAFRFLPTFDIDMAWAYRYRPWWLQLGGTAKALWTGQLQSIIRRWQTLLGIRPDPFYTFEYLRNLHPPNKMPTPIFFFLLADYGPFDKNTSIRKSGFRKLIADLAEDYDLGIHLSYRSNTDEACIPKEINRLKEITTQSVYRNRQHFLKLRFPDTYRRLFQYGIQEDYSMGYADDIGFRASIASPFPWYDLATEQATPLIIHPFALMEVSMQKYLLWSPEESWPHVYQMLEEVKRVGGFFATLWHNNSLSDLPESRSWRTFYERLLEQAGKLEVV